MTGIYIIKNTINGKRYVGQSIDIERRWRQHRVSPRPTMKKDIDIYGWDAFKFGILELCDAKDLARRETYYIKLLKPEYNGKNTGHAIKPETRKKLSIAHTGKILMPETRAKLSKSMHELASTAVEVVCVETQEIFRSLEDAANHLKIKPQNISSALHGRQKTAGGYTWKFVDESLERQRLNQLKDRQITRVETRFSSDAKPVICVETGELFTSGRSAAEHYGVSPQDICHALKSGKQLRGFHWKYSEKNPSTWIKCLETGELFECMNDAAKKYGIGLANLSAVIAGRRKSAGGLHWQRTDDPNIKVIGDAPRNSPRRVKCIETGDIFPSIAAANRYFGFRPSTIGAHLHGKASAVGGLHFKFVDDE